MIPTPNFVFDDIYQVMLSVQTSFSWKRKYRSRKWSSMSSLALNIPNFDFHLYVFYLLSLVSIYCFPPVIGHVSVRLGRDISRNRTGPPRPDASCGVPF